MLCWLIVSWELKVGQHASFNIFWGTCDFRSGGSSFHMTGSVPLPAFIVVVGVLIIAFLTWVSWDHKVVLKCHFPDYCWKFMCMSICLRIDVCVPCGRQCLRKPEEGVRSLELELQGVIRLLAWMLGTESRSAARAVCALSCCAVYSPRLRV